MPSFRLATSVALLTALLAGGAMAQPPAAAGSKVPADPALWSGLKWRGLGPARMGGRITDLSVPAADPFRIYVGAATGGLWRSKNRGVTFDCVFEEQGSAGVGAVCAAPSDPDRVYVGTGEANARNSVSWGDGVYRSDDGGETWRHVGLEATRHIGRIAVHPADPDLVWVAALGRIWGPSHERGLYVSRDGGGTWERSLWLDEDTGCIDVAVHPEDPDVVWAAAYAVRRDGFDTNDPARRFHHQSGLFKTTDGGRTWRRLHVGLPTVRLGRCGLTVHLADPDVLYATVETELIGKPAPGADAEEGGPAYMGLRGEDDEGGGVRLTEVIAERAAARAGLEPGDVLLELAGEEVKTFDQLVDLVGTHRGGEEVRLRYRREGDEQEIAFVFGSRSGSAAPGRLGGQQDDVQDRQGPRGFETGGLFRSDDGGETWRRVNSLNPRPFYFSRPAVCPRDPDRVFVCGIELFVSSDGGASFTPDGARGVHADHHALWIDPSDPLQMYLGCDGGLSRTFDGGKTWEGLALMDLGQFYAVCVDDRDPYRIYGGLQDNGTWVIPSRTRRRRGLENRDARQLGGGDGFITAIDPSDPDLLYLESQEGNLSRVNMRTGARARLGPARRSGQRFNWKTPFLLSPHNPRVHWSASQRLYRSDERGERARPVSEDLTLTDRGSITAIAESPVRAGIVWVGSDDGALWITRNGGEKWRALHESLPIPAPRWVACIEPCRKVEGAAWVVLDAHRSDEERPYVLYTDDYGHTWERREAGLPMQGSRVLRQDPASPDTLYLGNEVGVWFSLDAGRSWLPLHEGLPTVPVHDLAIQARERHLVAGTHGRSIWVLDIAPFATLDKDRLRAPKLMDPLPVKEYPAAPDEGRYGHQRFARPNPALEAVLWTWIPPVLLGDDEPTLRVLDPRGEVLWSEKIEARGLVRTTWDLRRGEGRRRPRVPHGGYTVELEAGLRTRRAILRFELKEGD